MHKAMAVLYRPITKKGINDTYEIEKYNGSITYSDVMKHAPLDVVFGANVFFYNLGKELLKSTMTYLENNKEIQTILQQHSLENDGGGILQSMDLLRETLQYKERNSMTSLLRVLISISVFVSCLIISFNLSVISIILYLL